MPVTVWNECPRSTTQQNVNQVVSKIRRLDRIIVMRAGQIIEQGNHAALMAQGGHYAELYNTYFRHQSLKYIEQVGAFGD